MKLTKCLLISAVFAVLPAMAFADPVTLDSPLASFSGAVGGTNVTNPTGAHDAEIRWGTPTGKFGTGPDFKSGFGFDFFDAPLGTTTAAAFNLGTFSHFNFEIVGGGAIQSVNLNFSFTITTPNIGLVTYTFPFAIDETSNNPPPACAETPVPATNFCPDIITFSSAGSSSTFLIGGVKYTLQLLGFGPDDTHIDNRFVTQEGRINTTSLWGKIDVATPPVNVPEPNAFVLMLLGLLALGGAVQLRRKQDQA